MTFAVRESLQIGAAALGLLLLPSFAMAAPDNSARGAGPHLGGARAGGGPVGASRVGGGGQMGGGRIGGPDFDRGGRMGEGRMERGRADGGGRMGVGRGEAGQIDEGFRRGREGVGRRAGGYGRGDEEIREFRERVRERHAYRERGFRVPPREREGRRFAYGFGRREGYGFRRGDYGRGFYGPVDYGYGYGRPRGRFVKVCTVRFVRYRY